MPEPDGERAGPVLVVGVGLLGTSVGLALTRAGRDVRLLDPHPEHVRTASGLGAGRAAKDGDPEPALVVVACPPDALGGVIAEQLLAHPDAVVTDVGSVKTAPLAALASRVDRAAGARYVGSHPMAGSERSGPLAASATLFEGRPWAVTPHGGSAPDAVAAVVDLAETCGAVTVTMSPGEHDLAVARTSHLPHLMAVLVAGRLADAPRDQLALSGQGVRDVTRVAGGDPSLWQQIVGANAPAVADLLREVRTDLDGLIGAVESGAPLAPVLDRGVAGVRAIPGKHGGPPAETSLVVVAVPDHPGELARLFADAGEIGVNIEDVRIDHDPGRPVGRVELTVTAAHAVVLRHALGERGWETQR
ncbi:prephenate dehydrogenase [Nocardioides sp. CFH 31398]|uniref:prephenate dehydrogenase n=1 Tax=Nocardioides sp. CFH 31398 TaxID=2919579 RepID=UPI001F051691|nr:prephenate dehydrogenase [Nocardioides sp. CFH 31398]MCH1867016.1 prephenate dehydrogenase [Nocardioides sp. CFH 31398]